MKRHWRIVCTVSRVSFKRELHLQRRFLLWWWTDVACLTEIEGAVDRLIAFAELHDIIKGFAT